ncbi:hypothetical protein FACS1894147_12300 [Spirochaetia bacterium]|nr:hypothetical protein FACS1894147_12300 [Spirochaetia bacterium]
MNYKSEIFEVMHQDALADFEIGAISAAQMKEYDKMCLVPEKKAARKVEERGKMGQVTPAAV